MFDRFRLVRHFDAQSPKAIVRPLLNLSLYSILNYYRNQLENLLVGQCKENRHKDSPSLTSFGLLLLSLQGFTLCVLTNDSWSLFGLQLKDFINPSPKAVQKGTQANCFFAFGLGLSQKLGKPGNPPNLCLSKIGPTRKGQKQVQTL